MKSQQVLDVAEKIAPLLEGSPLAIQGAVLAELQARWLISQPAELREKMLQAYITVMLPPNTINAKIRDQLN